VHATARTSSRTGTPRARGKSRPRRVHAAGVVIAWQSGHRLPPLTVEQNRARATAPTEELLGLPFLQPQRVPVRAEYQLVAA
jgi:hypothetical protein